MLNLIQYLSTFESSHGFIGLQTLKRVQGDNVSC